MGRRLPKNKTLDELDKKLDAIVDDIIEEIEPELDKAIDKVVDKVMDEPVSPPAEPVKLVALQNWVLDGQFIKEGDEFEAHPELADRLLTHTSAFRLAD